MKVANIAKSPSFGNALCIPQEKRLRELTELGNKRLGISTISTTIFGFSVPPGEYNTGIGSTFSKEGIETADFANTYFGANCQQVGPQGEISNAVRSPYSGTTFSVGKHNISFEKLTSDTYGNILSKSDLDESPSTHFLDNYEQVIDPEILNSEEFNPNDTSYDYIFSEEFGIDTLLRTAYKNFKSLPENSPLKQEFEDFKKENEYWLERDALYEAMACKNNTSDMSEWNYRDQNVFADENNIDYDTISELHKVEDKYGNNVVEYNEFIQFIAIKQQQETRKELNSRGIKLSGDCQIGYSQKDFWSHKSAFYQDGTMYGCPKNENEEDKKKKKVNKGIEQYKHTCWTPAIDMSKIDGEAGKLLRQKFATQFKRYDAIRIDAAWQLVLPCLVHSVGKKDKDGNLLGKPIEGEQPNMRAKIINILKEEARKANFDENKINLEFLDGTGASWRSLSDEEVKNAVKDMYCIHTMQHMHNGWGYPARYRRLDQDPFNHRCEISIGTHDDALVDELAYSLVDKSTKDKEKEAEERKDVISKELNIPKSSLEESQVNRRKSLYAMLFTNYKRNKDDFEGKISITLPDAVGSLIRRTNIPNTKEHNWECRLPKGWQRKYFENLTRGIGFNLPEAMSTALKKFEGKSELTDELDKYANILKSKDGPMTREEANEMYKNGQLNIVV